MTEKRTFYIVARIMQVTGIGAMFNCIASHTLYALKNGWIPIVDLKHYKNQYTKKGRAFKDNSWEYFFEQPCGMTLDDITDDDDVIISDNLFMVGDENGHYGVYVKDLPVKTVKAPNPRTDKACKKIRELIKFKPDVFEYIQTKRNNIIGKNDVVLGILARGTDYLVRKSYGEARQPHPKTIIKKAKAYLRKHPDITKIYLATEDDNIYKMFKKTFGDMLLDNNQYRFEYKDKNHPFLADIDTGIEEHSIQIAKDYLASLYILSKCKYFIGGRCNGSVMAYILQDSWQDVYIWQLGNYGRSRLSTFIKGIISIDNVETEDKRLKALVLFGKPFFISSKKNK